MKIRFILFSLSFIALMGCDKTEDVVFDPTTGQTGLRFESELETVSVPEEGITVNFEVQSTTASNVERTFPVMVDSDPEVTTANPEDYSVGSVVIPANSYIGSVAVTFNYDTLEDFVTNTVKLDLVAENGIALVRNPSLTITFLREFVCPDLVLTINFDDYPGETSWEITDSSGGVVATGGDYGGQSTYTEDLCLIDGDYTFTIFDSFGDGICCSYGTGNYEITLDGVVIVSGAEFGAEESTNFTVN